MNPSIRLFPYLFALAATSIMLASSPSFANDDGAAPAIDDAAVRMSIIEPQRDVGYTVGDILDRTVTLEVKKPYAMQLTSLPIIGYEHRYKGQVSGIELCRIRHEALDNGDSTIYTLYLAYQVFTNSVVAKPAILPAERIKFSITDSKTGKTKIVQYRIPSWGFRISPIATFGAVKIENDMSPLRGPLLLVADREKLRLKILAVILAASLLGLLYILGMHAWLPLMGRPFAKAYRAIRKAPQSPEGLQHAVSKVHEAFNLTAGYSVFSDNLDAFFSKKPKFLPIKDEIDRFFALSHQVFFNSDADDGSGVRHQPDSIAWLHKFCRHCRDCERGLVPDTLVNAGSAGSDGYVARTN